MSLYLLFLDLQRNKPILGRWCILNKEYNNRKIDMANIDHCGTCHYHYEKVNTIIHNKKESASFPIKVC
jgi:hypothetical protein